MSCWFDSWTALFPTPAQLTLDQGIAQGLLSKPSDRLAAVGKSPATGNFSRGYRFCFRSHIIRQPYCPAAGGYLGVALTALIASGSMVLPVPALATVCAASTFLVPLNVGLVDGGAETIGGSTGYFLGYSGGGVGGERRVSQRLGAWMRRRGWLLLFLLAFIPNQPSTWRV